MESQPQNPEFRNNPELFHPCTCKLTCIIITCNATCSNFVLAFFCQSLLWLSALSSQTIRTQIRPLEQSDQGSYRCIYDKI